MKKRDRFPRYSIGLCLSLAALLLAHSPVFSQTPASTSPAQRSGPTLSPSAQVLQQERGWKQDFERYLGQNVSAAVMEPTKIQSKLRQMAQQTGKKAAVIYMVPTPEQLELLLITANQAPVRRSVPAANRAALGAIAQHLREAVSDNSVVDTTSYLAPAQQLYQWLIAPLSPLLEQQKIETLILCVGSNLRSLPFAALHDGQRFLVERYSLSLIPAFSLTDSRYTSLKSARVLAMGASQFTELNPLPAVPLELSTIVQSQGGTSLLNRDFTVHNLQQRRQQRAYPIVHLATHADFRPGKVENSFIQFWDTPLPLAQLPQLRLNQPVVNLLVLSACRTALGDPQAELGFAGMAVQAGVPSVLGSLWYVSDVGTFQLMTAFYKHLKTAPIKAESLRQAQLDLIRSPRSQLFSGVPRSVNARPEAIAPSEAQFLSHPYYWAAFTLVGSPW